MLDNLSPRIRRRCLRFLYKICGRHAILPRSLEIPLCYDPKDNPLCCGGFGEVWKGEYRGREVAAKVLKVYKTSDLDQIKRVCSRLSVCVTGLSMSRIELLQGSRDMEDPSPSKCAAIVRCDGNWGSICDGIGMDDKRQHQGIHKVEHQRGPVGTCIYIFQPRYICLRLTTTLVVAC